MTRNSLPYKVECKSTYVFFELIAAFNCQYPAERYVAECAEANPEFSYRVKSGRRETVLLDLPNTR